MIVRLMGEGQFELPESVVAQLNALDDAAMAALEAGDEATLDARLDDMWQLVRARGTALASDDLRSSEVIIPPSDLTLEETRALVGEHGLIPDIPV
ncbi:MAG: hypothetical protein R3C15_07325 [Thermoleophilia bacterium]